MSEELKQVEVLTNSMDDIENRLQALKSSGSPAARLGILGVVGGPGAPKGVQRKTTKIVNALYDLFEEEEVKEKLRALLKQQKYVLPVLDRILHVLPKSTEDDTPAENRITVVIVNQENVKDISDKAGRGSDQGNSLEAQASGMLREQS